MIEKQLGENGKTSNRAKILDTKVVTLFVKGEADLSHFWDVKREQVLAVVDSQPQSTIQTENFTELGPKLSAFDKHK